MLQADVLHMVKTLEMMAEFELVISEFYQCAGDLWKEEHEIWTGLAQAEISRAGHIRKMVRILHKKPLEFETGRPLTTAAVTTAITGVRKNIERLKNGELTKKQALFISRDIEDSILESKYTEILKTKDMEYQTLISEVALQTETHKKLLITKIHEAQ